MLLRISQALQFQTAFLLIYSIVHAIADDTFSFFVTYHNYLGFREFAKYGEWSKFAASIGHQKLKGFQLQGALPPWLSDQGLCPRTSLGALPPGPRCRLALPRSPCVSTPLFLTWWRPWCCGISSWNSVRVFLTVMLSSCYYCWGGLLPGSTTLETWPHLGPNPISYA